MSGEHCTPLCGWCGRCDGDPDEAPCEWCGYPDCDGECDEHVEALFYDNGGEDVD